MNSSFKRTTLIVMIFSITTRVIAFLFKIYLSRRVGAETLGLYQISLAMIGLVTIFACSGIPLTVSRRTAELNAFKNQKAIHKTVTSGLILALITITITVTAVIIFRKQFLLLFADNRAEPLFYIMLPSAISTAIYYVIRAYFMGRKSYIIYSLTEFVEEILNVGLILLFISGILISVSYAKSIAIAYTIADIICFILIAFLYVFNQGKLAKPAPIKPLIKSSAPITMMRIFTSLAATLTAIILPHRMISGGMSVSEATTEYGRAVGMAFPLLYAPLAITSALSIVLLPEIAELFASKKVNVIAKKVDNSMSFISVTCGFFFIIYASLGAEIGQILYKDIGAGQFLAFASGLVMPLAMSQLTCTALNSLAKEIVSFINHMIGIAFMTLCLYFLPPYIGIYSLAVAMTGFYFISFVLNSIYLAKVGAVCQNYYSTLVKVTIFSLAVGAFTKLLQFLLSPHLSIHVYTTICGIAATILYASLIICFGLLDIRGFATKRKRKKT